jgi:hypothetical protein
MMNKDMMGYCGTYCETCDWKEKMNCKGCKIEKGHPFWGTCLVASCAISRRYSHCGECSSLPCPNLSVAFSHPEHGDTGERLRNLLDWSKGIPSMRKVRSKF